MSSVFTTFSSCQTVRTHWRSRTLHLTASWFNSTKEADIFTKKKKKKKEKTPTPPRTQRQIKTMECARRCSCGKRSRVQWETGTDCSLVWLLPNEEQNAWNKLFLLFFKKKKKGFQTSHTETFKRLVLNSIVCHSSLSTTSRTGLVVFFHVISVWCLK